MPAQPTIWHNPKCGTSRKVLSLLNERGIEPRIVEYLKTPPTREELVGLLAQLRMTPRQLLRRKEAAFAELRLDDPAKTGDDLIDAMLAHPILMERPIVATDKGTALCRTAEKVLEIIG